MISVVVPTHQRRESVLRLLRALADQDLPPTEFEAVVAVDRSTDGTAGAVGELEVPYRVRSVQSPRPGRAAACNAGIAAAAGELLVLLDDDMEPAPGCLRSHRDAHAPSGVCVMGAAPVRLQPSSSATERYVAARFAAHLEKLACEGPSALRDFYSGNASIARDDLQRVGGFDESFTVYGNEDLELAHRLRAHGIALRYAPAAIAYQRYTKSFAGLARDTIAKGRTAVLLASLHPETFDELQLAQLASGSRRWRAARALLLAGGRRATHALLRLAAALDRPGLARRRVVYAFLLDYFYWAGAAAALAEAPRDGLLEDVHRQLESDGPVRLLLHG